MKRLLLLTLVMLLAAPAQAFAEGAENDAVTVLDAWVAAQNDRDFAAYTALYAKSFVGIRRTSDGGEKKMKLKAWKADRKKMFKLKKVVVAADNSTVQATEKGAIVSFLQRWKGGGYADHGTKLLTMQYDAAGALLIVKEELLSSTPGWDDDPSAVIDATALVSPLQVRLRGEGIRANGDCTGVTYVLYLKDKKGKTIQREIGGGVIMSDEDGASTLKIEPSGTKGLLFDVGQWCAGGADYYQVKLSGDALVVLYKAEDEQGEVNPTFNTVLTIQLPPGAKVKSKR